MDLVNANITALNALANKLTHGNVASTPTGTNVVGSNKLCDSPLIQGQQFMPMKNGVGNGDIKPQTATNVRVVQGGDGTAKSGSHESFGDVVDCSR